MAYGSLPFLPVQNERLLENLAKEGEKKLIQPTNSGSDTDYYAWSSLFYLHFYPMLNLKLIHEGSEVLQNLIF